MKTAGIISAFAFCLLIIVSWQFNNISNVEDKFEALSARLLSLELELESTRSERFQVDLKQASSVDQNNIANDQSQDVYLDRIELLEDKISSLEQAQFDSSRQYFAEQKEAKTQKAIAVANRLINYGYVDNELWQEFSSDVESMAKQENKAFWQRTFAAIESGEIVVYNEE